MDETAEVNRKDEKIMKMAKEMNDMHRRHDWEQCKKKYTITTLQQNLEDFRQRNNMLEEEVMNLRKRLHTFTRSLVIVPHLWIFFFCIFFYSYSTVNNT